MARHDVAGCHGKGGGSGPATLGVDLTEHKALQEQYLQVQKLDSLGRLVGGVAQLDFNNLLALVINGGTAT